jgi:hypothetical protein
VAGCTRKTLELVHIRSDRQFYRTDRHVGAYWPMYFNSAVHLRRPDKTNGDDTFTGREATIFVGTDIILAYREV